MAINLGRSEGVRDRPLAARVVILGARTRLAYRTDSDSAGIQPDSDRCELRPRLAIMVRHSATDADAAVRDC